MGIAKSSRRIVEYTTVCIDHELLCRARELGINRSRVFERALRQAVRERIGQPQPEEGDS